MSQGLFTSGGSLRELGLAARLGLSALLVVISGGFIASGAHLINQHENRDERPGVSLTDLEGAYHGVQARAPLLEAIERGHPPELTAAERGVLLSWLGGKRQSEDYDSIELGADAPAEILARRCVACHSRAGLEGEHKDAKVSLASWSDVSKLAISRRVEPLPAKVLAASTHAHALALAPLSLLLAVLVFATRFGRRLGGLLLATSGLALLADLSSWWLAREFSGLTPLIVVSGGVYALANAVSILLILADLWLARPATRAA
ncbi:MAG TPA: hypothetical protein VK843_01130 [Planctomycetota bacterium]|nr:hypothetical protein [Planctomycetota bacterium]